MGLTGIGTLARSMTNAKSEAIFFAKPDFCFHSPLKVRCPSRSMGRPLAASGGLGAASPRSRVALIFRLIHRFSDLVKIYIYISS